MKRLLVTSLISVTLLSVYGCAKDDDAMQSSNATYEITVTNLTNHQVLTPPAAILHNASYSPWTLGSAASTGLEKLAEGGDTTDFIATATADGGVVASRVLSATPFAPGVSVMESVMVATTSPMYLSLASMLANTNDAFAGVNMQMISDLAVGESRSMMAMAYDAGTEANTETAATIPGPAGGGTGYDAARDDILDKVTIHAGVITMDDGLSTSVLDESYRWNGPVAKITVKRTQ